MLLIYIYLKIQIFPTILSKFVSLLYKIKQNPDLQMFQKCGQIWVQYLLSQYFLSVVSSQIHLSYPGSIQHKEMNLQSYKLTHLKNKYIICERCFLSLIYDVHPKVFWNSRKFDFMVLTSHTYKIIGNLYSVEYVKSWSIYNPKIHSN